MRWRRRIRSAAGPAGNPSMCWRERRTARSSPLRPAIAKAIRAANTCSTAAGPRPMSAPAAAITRSCRSRCRLRRRAGRGCCCAPARMRMRSPARWRAVSSNCAGLSGASGVHVTFATEPEFRLLGELGYLQRTDQQFHWENPGFANFDDFLAALTARKRKTIRRERHDALAKRHQRALAHRQRSHRRRVGRVLRILHGDRFAQMGPALSDAVVLFAGRRENARPHRAGDGQARRALDRRRHQFHRLAHFIRPPLGRHRASPVPAFRALLLPGDRLRDRAQDSAGRGRRPGRTQDLARLHADHDLFGALYRRSRRCAAPSPTTWCANAPMSRPPAPSLPRWRRSARISPSNRND